MQNYTFIYSALYVKIRERYDVRYVRESVGK